ncbi:MAG: PBSX family phage terminase large subunit [Firmicutes bacterium]|nr:PBSX family phage terminase large subunit [Bacillota bacterium]
MNEITINPSQHIIQAFDGVLERILAHSHTDYLFTGGRGGTKSTFIPIAIILLILLNPQAHAIIFRKVGNTIRDSVFANICFAVELLGVSQHFKIKKSPLEVIFTPTGQRIMFRGGDEPAKIKSIRPPFGYFGVTWFEELDQFRNRQEIRTILQSTMRGAGGKFWNFESFNPPKSRDAWVNEELIKGERDSALHTKVSYLDVPVEWLSQEFFDRADELKKLNPTAYEHEYLGIATGNGGSVFENLEERFITNDELKSFDRLHFGIDFGFSLDEFCWIKLHFDKPRRILYFLDEIYETRLLSRHAADKIKQKHSGPMLISCDNSDAKSIAELQSLGINAQPAKKGPDSVRFGTKFLQDLNKLVFDKRRTPNAYKEFATYEYATNKDGKFISAYPDKNNHAIDATRYAMESAMLESRIGVANIRLY